MLDLLYTAVRQRIAAVWPEVAIAADGVTLLPILEADHVDRIPWELLTPPFSVIAIEDCPVDTDFAAVNEAGYLAQVELYYVAEATGPLSPIRAKLEAMRDDLLTDTLDPNRIFQVTPGMPMTWSRELEPNQLFAAKNMSHRAGRLTVPVLFGLTMYQPQ